MWTVGLCAIAVVAICFTYWQNKWSNPKCNGVLPPGSMGPLLIGESFGLLVRSYSLDLHPFIKKRAQRYGPIFRTSLVGRPVIVSTDPEFNHLLAKQEGRLVEQWYLDSFSKIFNMDGENKTTALGLVHNHIRSIVLNQTGGGRLKERLFPQFEEYFNKTLHKWSNQPSVELKRAASGMVFEFSAANFFGYDSEKSPLNLSEKLVGAIQGLMSFPLNIPGTAYHKCLKDRNEAMNLLRNMVKERIASPEKSRGDFLDQAINDMQQEKVFTEELIAVLLFCLSFVTFDSISLAISLTLKLVEDHPSVFQELTAEHEAILKKRENPNSTLTWDEYKSMTFTHQVINEALRLGPIAPGLLRKALKDIEFKGYTIPAGWTIMLANLSLHVDPNTYKDPLAFNPWRWKDLDQHVVSKNFMPFGGGIRQCAGAEYSKVFLASFLHVLVTKYRWTKVKGGKVARAPILGFVDGIHINFSKKSN